MNTDVKTMLALAALTYRGFGKHTEAAIASALRPWLPKLADEGLGNWELVWGPASFRARTSLFDDAMMYVAQRQDGPAGEPHYVVAIRGTNPISFFDWIFGDFFVSLQMDWSNAGDGARLSGSTAIGMAITRHLAAEDPPSEGSKLDAFGNAVSIAFEHLSDVLPELEPAHLLQKTRTISDAELLARISTLIQFTGEKSRLGPLGSLFDRFVDSIQPLQDKIRKDVFDKLVREIETTRDKGKTLLDFLKSVTSNSKVSVTGHSKGGALSVATALWLAEEWAPNHPAQIEAFSFAGPTPGNGAFKTRYDARLTTQTHRIVNPRDIVPHAFSSAELRGLRETYPLLGPALKLVSDSVERLDYQHVGGELITIDAQKAGGNLLEEIIRQHLDAYLAAAHFQGSSWDTRSIFLDE